MNAAPPHPSTLPHGRTARRLEWVHLPPMVRRAVEKRLGSPVTDAISQDAGFTPGLASVLTCADGSRHFVKAASVRAQRFIADAYREEARKLRMLPPEAPAPRLQWVQEVEDWLVLGIEYVDARPPGRPWTADDLAAASGMLVEAARILTPAPGIGLETAEAEFAAWPGHWETIPERHPELDPAHVAEAQQLSKRYVEVTAGDTLVHTDVRDDNLLLRPDGSVLLCDWNWPCRGAAWLDSLTLLIGPRGDGLDMEAHLAGHPLLREVPAEDVDTVLALLAAYFFWSADQPRVSNSPYLRAAQAWQRDVVWEWLAERRGWAVG